MAEIEHAYDRHVGRYGRALATSLIELAGIKEGDHVLDVGCGTGQLTTALAALVGEGNVAALDPSQEFVEVCRARLPGADVRVGSAEALPFADGAFDAVLTQLVINLVDDPPSAAGEMARVARPGAPVCACTWDDEEMPLLRSFWDALRGSAPEETAQVSSRSQVGLPNPGLLKNWWIAAGLGQVTLEEFEVTADYRSFEDLWLPFEAGVGGSGRLYVSLSPAQGAAVRADTYRRLGSPKGSFELRASVHAVRGIRKRGPA